MCDKSDKDEKEFRRSPLLLPVTTEKSIELKESKIPFHKRLAEIVRHHPCLYDPECHDYQNEDLKEKTWDIVATKCARERKECISGFEMLLKKFGAFYITKMVIKLGLQNVNEPVAFQFYEDMEFFKPFIPIDLEEIKNDLLKIKRFSAEQKELLKKLRYNPNSSPERDHSCPSPQNSAALNPGANRPKKLQNVDVYSVILNFEKRKTWLAKGLGVLRWEQRQSLKRCWTSAMSLTPQQPPNKIFHHEPAFKTNCTPPKKQNSNIKISLQSQSSDSVAASNSLEDHRTDQTDHTVKNELECGDSPWGKAVASTTTLGYNGYNRRRWGNVVEEHEVDAFFEQLSQTIQQSHTSNKAFKDTQEKILRVLAVKLPSYNY